MVDTRDPIYLAPQTGSPCPCRKIPIVLDVGYGRNQRLFVISFDHDPLCWAVPLKLLKDFINEQIPLTVRVADTDDSLSVGKQFLYDRQLFAHGFFGQNNKGRRNERKVFPGPRLEIFIVKNSRGIFIRMPGRPGDDITIGNKKAAAPGRHTAEKGGNLPAYFGFFAEKKPSDAHEEDPPEFASDELPL